MKNQEKIRRYEFDWLRVLAFSLLIFFHTGMFFVRWNWHVKNSILSPTMELPMLFLSQWRMSLIFIISGVGVYFALGYRSAGTFALERLKRIFVPLIVGMLLVVPPQVYFERLTQGFTGSYFNFLPSVFDFEPYPKGNFSWHHLWYLAYILVYSLLFLPLLTYLRRTSIGLQKVKGWMLLVLPALWFSFGAVLLNARFPGTNDLIHDWANHFMYTSMFLIGFLLMKFPVLQERIRRVRWYSLVAALVTVTVLYTLYWLKDNEATGSKLNLYFILKSCNRWFWLLAILGFALQHLKIRSRYLPLANEMVYPFYILHQPIIVALGYYMRNLPLVVGVKFGFISLSTFILCFVLVRYVIMPINFLRVPFGLKAVPRPQPLQVPLVLNKV
ncbi:acyltransferase family protein [Pontibacter chitinilyticus]|uniref:acyltransferase family protein n=1 Tax=Pontibacter chitinilyticus TaxID=2674989 RepID=UPI0032198C3E